MVYINEIVYNKRDCYCLRVRRVVLNINIVVCWLGPPTGAVEITALLRLLRVVKEMVKIKNGNRKIRI